MRIFFVSDIHGSNRCWRKFLAAARFYEVDTIIVGGDITGKFVVPIVAQPDGTWTASFMGERKLRTRAEVDELVKRIADQGSYTFETTEDEYATYEGDQTKIDDLFKRLVLQRVGEWVQIADERLNGKAVRCFVSGANDDFYEVDDILRTSQTIEVPDLRVVEVDGMEMLSVGYGNPTPWNCPRDIPESELVGHIEALASQLRAPERAVFNLHVPPYGSGLDFAPQLDERLSIVVSASGEVQMIAVGSTAVRDAIAKYRPALSLHGHIHESRGIRRIGPTTVVNPGSQYQEGILDGAVVEIDARKGVVRAQLVSG